MEITVTYTIADDDTLHIVYNGKADADTVMNCTNHSYFNLNGHESGSIEGQVLQIFADAYTPVVDSSAIPTGEIASVEGTPMDFRTEKQIGQDIRADFERLHFTGGYDHNYVLGRPGEKKIMANAYCRESGIALEAETDWPWCTVLCRKLYRRADRKRWCILSRQKCILSGVPVLSKCGE